MSSNSSFFTNTGITTTEVSAVDGLKTAAEAAKTAAETAQAAAETAKSGADTAKSGADTSATAAATSATAAASSATAASTSATAAATSATAAAASASSVNNYTGGTGITVSGTTITNDSPDQTVALTAGSNVSVSGTYPNFTISSTDTNTTYSVGDGGLTEKNFTTALKSKLDAVEANATADQSNAEIRAAVEAATDSNVFTDADHSKLDGIATSANNYSLPTASGSTLGGIKIGSGLSIDGSGVVTSSGGGGSSLTVQDEGSALSTAATTMNFVGNGVVASGTGATKTITVTDTNTTYSVGDAGLSEKNFTTALKSKLDGIEASATADQTAAEIRTLVEAATDSNVFTDADHTKLNAIEASADVTDTANVVAALTAGTNVSIAANGTISSTDTNTTYSVGDGGLTTNDFTNADHTKLDGIATSANNYSAPNHSGEVTSTGDGATVIADNVVDEANLKVSNSPTNGYVLTAQSGNTGGLTWAAASGGGGDPDLYRDNASSATTPSATGANAVAIGSAATASGAGGSVAIGFEATSSGHGGMALGDNATASGTRGVAFQYSTASGVNGFAAVGTHSSATYGAIGQQSVTLSQLGIASGNNSALLGGANNTSSGIQSVAIGGEVNTAAGEASYAYGKRAKATEIGKYAFGHQLSGTVGATQGGMMILAAATTDATATVLRSNNNAASAMNQIVAASDTAITFDGTITAMQNGAQAYASWRIEGLLVNDGGTTTLANSATTVISNGSSWGMALSADNTNNALAITFTGEASHNIRAVANIRTTEVTYA